MISKSKISEIRKLHQKKFRQERQLFLVEGEKSVHDLLESTLRVAEIFATEAWFSAHEADVAARGLTCNVLSISELERISCFTTASPVIALVHAPSWALSDLDARAPILVLDDIRDPGNLGTIIRTADWFGVSQIVCSENTVELTNPKTIQATMGSFGRVKVCYTALLPFLQSQRGQRKIYGTFLQGTDIQQVSFSNNDIIVIGSESNGISDALQSVIDARIHIPSPRRSGDKAESLNAAIATAIVLYQCVVRSV